MEVVRRCKRKRVYSFNQNGTIRAAFSHNYVNYLLPALVKIGTDSSYKEKEDGELERIVRFEVDMALVLSASGFGWSHALKHKLERDMNTNDFCRVLKKHPPTALSIFLKCKHSKNSKSINGLLAFPPPPRPLFPVNFGRKSNPNSKNFKKSREVSRHPRTMKKIKIRDEKEELGFRLETLRRLLPGGDEMGGCELLSNVESYIICLELQVSILRSIVNMH